jgi:hypothetical protein
MGRRPNVAAPVDSLRPEMTAQGGRGSGSRRDAANAEREERRRILTSKPSSLFRVFRGRLFPVPLVGSSILERRGSLAVMNGTATERRRSGGFFETGDDRAGEALGSGLNIQHLPRRHSGPGHWRITGPAWVPRSPRPTGFGVPRASHGSPLARDRAATRTACASHSGALPVAGSIRGSPLHRWTPRG